MSMKLSEAIRQGCEAYPHKCKHGYFQNGDKACALGAAIASYVGRRPDSPYDIAEKILPGRMHIFRNPVTGETDSMYNIIIDLNDSEDWTREQIADWLDTADDGKPVYIEQEQS